MEILILELADAKPQNESELISTIIAKLVFFAVNNQ